MKLNIRCTVAALCGMLPLLVSPASAAPACGVCRPDIDTPAYYSQVAKNYLNLWGGDYSLLNATLSPEINFSSDRFPTGNGTEELTWRTAAEFRGFVERVREGWQKYGFEVYKSAGSDYNVFIRWRLEAIVGSDFPPQLSSTLKAGDRVTYNGTDSLVLNKCTGLADEIDSAQDFLILFRTFGWKNIVL